MIELCALTLDDLKNIAEWRNYDIASFRTGRPLTNADQEAYFKRLATDKTIRMWGIRQTLELDELARTTSNGIEFPYETFGYGGLENIDWENRTAEISLFIRLSHRLKGLGTKAVDLIMQQAFDYMSLHTVWGEAYGTTTAPRFWYGYTCRHGGSSATFTDRKYFGGRYYSSFIFQVTDDKWREKCALYQ